MNAFERLQSELKTSKIFSEHQSEFYGLFLMLLEKTLLSPLEVLKVRYQVSGEMIKNGSLSQNYQSYWNCLASTVKEEGARALFKGNLTGCIIGTLSTSNRIMFSQHFRRELKKLMREGLINQNLINTISTAAVLAYSSLFSLIEYPLQYARIRLIADKQSMRWNGRKQFTGIYNAMNETVKKDGLRGIFRGAFVSLGEILVYRLGYFSLYEAFTSLFGQTQNFVLKFGMSYTITLLAAALVYPLNTVQHRMIMRSIQEQKYSWSGNCFRKVVTGQGFKALYRGFPIQIFRSVSGALILINYDAYMSRISQRQAIRQQDSNTTSRD